MVEVDFAVERAFVAEFGPTFTRCLVHFVVSLPREEDAGLGIAAGAVLEVAAVALPSTSRTAFRSAMAASDNGTICA